MITVNEYHHAEACSVCLTDEEFLPYMDEQGELTQHNALGKMPCDICGDKDWGHRFGGLIVERRTTP